MSYYVIEFDAKTGEENRRPMTPDETAAYEANVAAQEERDAQIIENQQALEVARQSAIAKLAALGLTEAEAQAVIGQ